MREEMFVEQDRREETQDEPAGHTEGDEHNKECFKQVGKVSIHQSLTS